MRTKAILLTIVMLLLVAISHAATYVVNVKSDLNVRSAPSSNSTKLGQLHNNDVVNVLSFNGEWAVIEYNGQTGYISSKYIVKNTAAGQAQTKKSNNEGFTFWDGVKWLFIIAFGFIVVRFLILFVIKIIAGGIIIGGLTLAACFVFYLFGWMSSDTMWTCAQWGFYAGLPLGLWFSLSTIGDTLEEACDTSSSGSSSGSSGLKRVVIEDENGHTRTLEQTSKYSECNYRDISDGTFYEKMYGDTFVKK